MLYAGFDYDETRYGYDEAALITVCSPYMGGSVRLLASSIAISVSPDLQGGRGPFYWFRVTVKRGASGHLDVEAVNDSGHAAGGYGGPRIIPDGDGWRFGPWGP